MAEQYLHTLIPSDANFAPSPEQVTHFIDSLSRLGAQPLNCKLILVKPSGRVRTVKDPMTGEARSIPAHERAALKGINDLPSAIGNLQEYFVNIDGEGPPRVPAFPLYVEDAPFTGTYAFAVNCCLKPEPVSMSCLADNLMDSDVPLFGQPCSRRDALYCHPATGAVIEVASVGSARFWVEFEFGKWLTPKIGDSLNILDPSILATADHAFSARFSQGFHLF
jgi:hypothetical protein